MNTKVVQLITGALAATDAAAPVASSMAVRLLPRMRPSAVLFDVFGTLLRTRAAEDSDLPAILSSAARAAEISLPEADCPQLMAQYRAEIVRLKKIGQEQRGVHAEINVADAWANVLLRNVSGCTRQQAEEFAFAYTVLSAHPHEMPGMARVLAGCTELGIPIGAVSNAQYFTLHLVNYLATGLPLDGSGYGVFDGDLCSLSFQHRVVKPDRRMFSPVLQALAARSIHAPDCLFVGNDMYRDMYPARQAGFKTVLFAGDTDSLRLRPDNKHAVGIRPDYIIHSLAQLLDIIS